MDRSVELGWVGAGTGCVFVVSRDRRYLYPSWVTVFCAVWSWFVSRDVVPDNDG